MTPSRGRLDHFFVPSLAMSRLDLQKVLVKLLEVDFGDERPRVLAGLWSVQQEMVNVVNQLI